MQEWGFKINPYDWYVANKMINGKQCTIGWHVDDIKISHVNSEVVDGILNKLDERYVKESPMVTTRGKIHNYLGMKLDYNINGKVQIIMFKFIAKRIEEFPMELDGEPTSPAANHLFEVYDNGIKLKPEQNDRFHEFDSKIIFLGKQSRPDLQTAISFISTIVRDPDIASPCHMDIARPV